MNEQFTNHLIAAAERLLEDCRLAQIKVTTAESCTGGLLAGLLTEVPGSSDVFERGFVTYSNEAKAEMLDVPQDLIAQHGAVSAEVARSMAIGALKRSRANVSASVTGIAGPGGATPGKPVGLVFIGVARQDMETQIEKFVFDQSLGRSGIRRKTVEEGIRLLHSSVMTVKRLRL